MRRRRTCTATGAVLAAVPGQPVEAPWSTHPQRARGGFTLVELLVAIMVLVVGLLAMAGTSAVVTRQIGGGSQMALAATMAQGRFEMLRSQQCTTLASGSDEARGISEAWTVTPLSRSVQVTHTVTFTTTRGPRTHAYKTLIPCPALP